MSDINDYSSQDRRDFYDYCFNSSSYEIPKQYEQKFAVLYHITTYQNARAILQSREIKGDNGLHANFAVHPRPDLAAGHGIVLKFAFEGRHRAAIDLVGKPRVTYSKYHKDVIYHVYTVAADLELENGFLNNYWQTIAYPGTTDLKFIGLHDPEKEYADVEFNSFIGKEITITGADSNFHFPFI